MGLYFKQKQLQHFYTSVTMRAEAVRQNSTLHTNTVANGKRICRMYWYLVWKYYFVFCSVWSCVSILNCSSWVICWCSLVYLSIAQVRHFFIREKKLVLFDSRDHNGFCNMIMTMGPEPPTHCCHVQVLMCSEEFPRITPSQTFHAPEYAQLKDASL